MSSGKCCSTENGSPSVYINVNVDVPKIIKYLSIAGILIVGIIFGTRCFQKMMENGFFETIEK